MARVTLFQRYREDPVYFLGLLLSSISIVIAALLALARPLVLRLALFLVKSLISPDGILTYQGLIRLNNGLNKVLLVSFIFALMGYGYILVWQYFSLRLPAVLPLAFPSQVKVISFIEYIVLFIILGAATVIRLHSLNRGLYYDELFSAFHFIKAETFYGTISTYYIFNNHILYSIFGRIAASLFGDFEWVVRLPALLLGLGSIAFLWYFARREFSPEVGILSALFLALSPSHVLWSVSARGYTGLLFFTLISGFLFFKIIRSPKRTDTVFFIIMTVMGIYVHLYAVWVMVGQYFLTLILAIQSTWRKRPVFQLSKESFRFLWLSIIAIGFISSVCYLPVINQLLHNIQARGQGTVDPQFPLVFIDEISGNSGVLISLIGFLFVLLGIFANWQQHKLMMVYIGSISLLPLLASWLLLHPHDLYARFFSFIVPYYAILAVLGILAFLRYSADWVQKPVRIASWIFLGCVLLICLYAWSTNSWNNISEEAQYRNAINALTKNAGTSVTLCVFGSDAEIFQFYTARNYVIPETIEDLDQLVAKSEELRCAYHAAPWNPGEYKRMAAKLAEIAVPQEFKRMTVYTYIKIP